MEKRIAILGAGESGVGAALLAKQNGYAVWVSDIGSISASRKKVLTDNSIPFEEGQHTEEKILGANEIIKSPGIPYKAPIIKAAIEKGISIIDELEFAFRFSKGKVIAITGTNGKTTTAMLTFHLMSKSGLDVGLAGNIGQSWAAQLTEGDKDWWVIETSSFQIDGFVGFKPTTAILTNITPDHLDRYEYRIENYIASKISLFKNMGKSEHAIYFLEDSNISKGLRTMNLNSILFPVSLKQPQERGGYYDGDMVHLRMKGKKLDISTNEIILKGKHNMLNVMCASAAAMIAGVSESDIRKGLRDFQNAPHRMEVSGTLNGVLFINDSKGTNIDATAYALESYNAPLIWIAGGVDKGNDYSILFPILKNKVKMLICLGKENEKLKQAFTGKIEKIKETQDIAEAVSWGLEHGQSGDIVLLSPACASFDLFKNYEDRGEQFKAAVQKLTKSSAK